MFGVEAEHGQGLPGAFDARALGVHRQSVTRSQYAQRSRPREDVGRAVEFHSQGFGRVLSGAVRHLEPQEPDRFASHVAADGFYVRQQVYGNLAADIRIEAVSAFPWSEDSAVSR
jgi:hypothetical protein